VCRARLEELGLPAGEVFIDAGRSAWNPSTERPDWDKLMARLESGKAGGVIVFDLERFSQAAGQGMADQAGGMRPASPRR
jgi:DNA invertase Pin-like site-specific DNA recombinase